MKKCFIHCLSYYSLLYLFTLCTRKWTSILLCPTRFLGYWNDYIFYKGSWITYSWHLCLSWTNVNADIFAEVSMLQIFSSKRTKLTSTNSSLRREYYINFWRALSQTQFSCRELHHYTLWAFKICILFEMTSSSLMLYAIWNINWRYTLVYLCSIS